MNIFYVDKDPIRAADALCDKHVVKMVLESAQILSTAAHLRGLVREHRQPVYKPTHVKHPCVLWATENGRAYLWLTRHALALASEYRYRYFKEHASLRVIDNCAGMQAMFGKDRMSWKEPPQCMPEKYKGPDAVKAYRQYYIKEKAHIARWEHGREPPRWWFLDSAGYEHIGEIFVDGVALET